MTEWTEGNRQLSGGIEGVAYGTVAADLTGWIGIVQDFKGGVKKTVLPNQGFGLSGGAHSLSVTANDIAPSIETYLQSPALFKFLGALVTTGAGPYTHTISQNASPGSFSLVDTNVDPAGGSAHNTRQYVGCKLASLALAYPTKERIKATWGLTAQAVTKTTTKQTLTATSAAPYLVANTVLNIDGSPEAGTYNATVNIDTGLASDNHVFNSLNIVEQAKGPYNTTITLDRNFTNADLFDDIVAGTEVDITLVTTRGANDTMTVTLSDCQYSDHDKSSGYKEKQKENVTLTAESFGVVFVDSVTAYANL